MFSGKSTVASLVSSRSAFWHYNVNFTRWRKASWRMAFNVSQLHRALILFMARYLLPQIIPFLVYQSSTKLGACIDFSHDSLYNWTIDPLTTFSNTWKASAPTLKHKDSQLRRSSILTWTSLSNLLRMPHCVLCRCTAARWSGTDGAKLQSHLQFGFHAQAVV